jgi:hypothetical protein
MEIRLDQFLSQRDPQFGLTNPERMNKPSWELMVNGKYWAWWAREKFNTPPVKQHEPIWCFDRFGMTTNKLADGRIIHIGGEHEDWYDEDFYIYNDVIVLESDDSISIFGYPKEAFPPTDFHSSTFIEDRILIIGGLGYIDERQPGFTPVYWLDCNTYQIEAFKTIGENPGWIWEHKAELNVDNKTVTVKGGELYLGGNSKKDSKKNRSVYSLDLVTGLWRKLS